MGTCMSRVGLFIFLFLNFFLSEIDALQNFAQSKEACTMVLFIHLHYVLHYPMFHDQCALSCASPQSLSTILNSYCIMKREISRTMTFRLHHAHQFVEKDI